LKALLIEDTLTSATLVSHQFRKIGIEPIVARDGEKGIELFKQEHPDLILLDIIMPGMDGFEVARRIRQLEQAGEWTPIIFLTARTSDEDLEKGIAVGGDDYLIKPVSETVLAAKVRAMQRIAQMRYSLLVLTRKLDEANQELTRLSSSMASPASPTGGSSTKPCCVNGAVPAARASPWRCCCAMWTVQAVQRRLRPSGGR
jgi:DNA-binding response OmpR family regulator